MKGKLGWDWKADWPKYLPDRWLVNFISIFMTDVIVIILFYH